MCPAVALDCLAVSLQCLAVWSRAWLPACLAALLPDKALHTVTPRWPRRCFRVLHHYTVRRDRYTTRCCHRIQRYSYTEAEASSSTRTPWPWPWP